MSQTKRERKKIAKKHKRRKAYETLRNRLQGRKKKIILKPIKQSEAVDGAEFYKKLKEQERAQKKPVQDRKGNLFTKLMNKFTRGRQK